MDRRLSGQVRFQKKQPRIGLYVGNFLTAQSFNLNAAVTLFCAATIFPMPLAMSRRGKFPRGNRSLPA
jgi:hypothetical protein